LYSKNKEFTNYLIYILNDENLDHNIRNISGLTLKGIIERQFNDLEEEEIKYFKKNIFKSYFDKIPTIRRTISNLLNSYLRKGGVESWSEILEILDESLNDDLAVEMSLETLVMIFEDSGHLLEEKYKDVNYLFFKY
jgi:predicted nucleic acid-binding protein